MAMFSNENEDIELKENTKTFLKKLESDMMYSSNYIGGMLSFEWLDEIEYACPFIDNIMRQPKIALVREEEVAKIEKAKKINVSSVKDLSRHTEYIKRHDKETGDIEPDKILDIRNEETYNTYENRFLYTLYKQLVRFVLNKEEELNNFNIKDEKMLEYKAKTHTNEEKVDIQIKISTESLPTNKVDKKLAEQVKGARLRLKRVKDYMNSWQRSEVVKALDRAKVPLVNPPIKKTNVILKNPNFRVAAALWEYLNKYENREDVNDNLNNEGNDILKGFLDHSFLIDFFILDSIDKSKREQKKKLAERSMLLLTEEIHRIIALLINMGMNVDEDKLLAMISKEIKQEKQERLVGIDDVKKKFKKEMDEYLERIQGNL